MIPAARVLPLLLLLPSCGGPGASPATATPATVVTAPDSNSWHVSGHVLQLIGRWIDSTSTPGIAFHEHWQRTDDAFYAGEGTALRGADTVFHEALALYADSLGYVYAARVPGDTTYTHFRLTHANADSMVFELPEHDFPQRIVYAVEGEGWHAYVDGMVNGTYQADHFHFRPLP